MRAPKGFPANSFPGKPQWASSGPQGAPGHSGRGLQGCQDLPAIPGEPDQEGTAGASGTGPRAAGLGSWCQTGMSGQGLQRSQDLSVHCLPIRPCLPRGTDVLLILTFALPSGLVHTSGSQSLAPGPAAWTLGGMQISGPHARPNQYL